MKKTLLDSNIFQFGINPGYSADVASIFESLKEDGYDLAVSAYTTFEVYRGLSHQRIPDMKQLVNELTPLEVDLTTFKIAAVLTTCYKNHPATKGFFGQFSDGDIVLGASALRYRETRILTGNPNDFPSPFFEEESVYTIRHAMKRSFQTIVLKRPNREVYTQARDEHFPKKVS